MTKIAIDLQVLMNESALLATLPAAMRKEVEKRVLALPPEKRKKAALIFLNEKNKLQTIERERRRTILTAFSQALTDAKTQFLRIMKKRSAGAEKAEKSKAVKKSLSQLKNA